MSRLVEGGILTVLFFVVVNVVFLNLFLISKSSNNTAAATTNVVQAENYVCDDDCQKKISVEVLKKITPQETVPSIEGKNTENVPHEFIIPLGNGVVSTTEFSEIAGVENSIDTSLYPKIKKVTFETYMSIPTANGFAFVKLYNVTDKHDVWNSEQSMETNMVTFRESAINLDKGKKLYRVMMKSTMGYEVKLINARLRIITD